MFLGPKNRTPENVVKEFLNSKEFFDVQVEPSEIPYRSSSKVWKKWAENFQALEKGKKET